MSALHLLSLLAERDVRMRVTDGRLEIDGPSADTLDAEEIAFLREHRIEITAGLLAEPAAHCACGSPSFWRASSSPSWACAWCEPRPAPLPAGFEALTLDSGRWREGTAPPAPTPTTRADLLRLHGPTVAGCRTLDVLDEADDDDLFDLRDFAALEAFARALVADRRIRPLPDPALPPLERLALELDGDVGELRRWLDLSAVGRRIRQRIEREACAVDRCLLALRGDPAGGLLVALGSATNTNTVSNDTIQPIRFDSAPPADRVQNAFGAWSTPAEHEAFHAYDRHHWRCPTCQRAGRGYGQRCADGERLHAATRMTDR